jgi:adenylate cyclase
MFGQSREGPPTAGLYGRGRHSMLEGTRNLGELRLLLEELCCDLCRFEHVIRDGLAPEAIRIDREYWLAAPGAFADIRVAPSGQLPYFVEVKFGYTNDMLVRHLARKYASPTDVTAAARKVVLVVDRADRIGWDHIEQELRSRLHPGLDLEVWDEDRLLSLLAERFGVSIPHITPEDLLDVRQAIDCAKGFHAFGGSSLAEYEHDPLKAELLWHFGFWRLKQLRSNGRSTPRDILPPGQYHAVAVLLADLCSFSSYVRDTSDAEIVRECLTSFYSKARYQIINNGGMLYQFAGDEVIGLFGLPDHPSAFTEAVLDTASARCRIGESVMQHWQRRIDRVQDASGLHVGIALGDLQIVSLRPFSRLHVGAIGDCINVASRLLVLAGPSEVVISNAFHQRLAEHNQGRCTEIEPVEARNVGRIRAWKLASTM